MRLRARADAAICCGYRKSKHPTRLITSVIAGILPAKRPPIGYELNQLKLQQERCSPAPVFAPGLLGLFLLLILRFVPPSRHHDEKSYPHPPTTPPIHHYISKWHAAKGRRPSKDRGSALRFCWEAISPTQPLRHHDGQERNQRNSNQHIPAAHPFSCAHRESVIASNEWSASEAP